MTKEAKTLMALAISLDYILEDVKGQQGVSMHQQQKKGKRGLIGQST